MVDEDRETSDIVAVETTASTWPKYILGRIDFFLDRPRLSTRSERLGYLTLMVSMFIAEWASPYVGWAVVAVGSYLLFRVPKWSRRYQPWTLRRVGRSLLIAYVVFVVAVGTLGLIGLFL